MSIKNEIRRVIPPEFYLSQNYPNPFYEKTTIKYCIAYRTSVLITIYDSAGEIIKRIVDEEKKPGTYQVEFDPGSLKENVNEKGNEIYTCRLEAGTFVAEKKMCCLYR